MFQGGDSPGPGAAGAGAERDAVRVLGQDNQREGTLEGAAGNFIVGTIGGGA